MPPKYDALKRRSANTKRLENDQWALGRHAMEVAEDVDHLDSGGAPT